MSSSPNSSPKRAAFSPGMRHGAARIEKAKDTRRAIFRLAAYLRPFALTLLLVFALIVLTTVLNILGPYLMGQAIDLYISAGDIAGLGRTALWMLLAYLLAGGFQAATNLIMARVSQQALKQVRSDLFQHLQALSLRFFDQNPAGELMSRLTNDIDAINQAVSSNITALLGSVLSLVGIIAAMFLLNVWLALSSLLVIPIMFWFTSFVARYTRRGFRELQKNLGELNGAMEETISGQRVVKAYRRTATALDKFKEYNQAVYQAGLFANTYSLMLMPLTNVLGNLFIIVMAGAGGWLALQGLVSVGTIATFINYGRQFIQPLRQLADMFNSVQAALAGAERVFEVLDTPIEVQDVPNAAALPLIQGQVDFEKVSFGYNPETPVIKNMSLHAEMGETIALVGPTGAGKTTIINLLTRFYDIESGVISIDGKDIRQVKKADLRRQLGLVLQDTFLFADTVMANIRYGRLEASDEEVIQAARLAGADTFIRQLPDGYQTDLTERGSNLSKGQQQLLTIARAILADPRILILDEATSSVDTRTELHIQQALLHLRKGRTSFVIAHRLSTVRDADRLVVIDNGEIVEQGSHQELLEQQGFYYNLYMRQFKGIAI